MTVDAIKDAITGLPDKDKIALAAWLHLQPTDEWDRQMARDFAPGGRGVHVIEKVKADIRAGKFRPMISRPAPSDDFSFSCFGGLVEPRTRT